ncbi:MAG: hypothetical protein B7Z14_03655 [Bosea sp. 32-68-6]|nr:MAG: hypothetical protein B7Z14_03655 [Bosea sp. 32-68-6]
MEAAMAFLPLLPSSGARVTGKRLRIAVDRAGKRGDRRRISFSISRELAEALAWQIGDRIVASIGLGDDWGRVQLARVERPGAGHKLTAFAQSKVLRIAVTTPVLLNGTDLTSLLDPFLDPASVDFHVGDGTLAATLAPLRQTQPAVVIPFS